MDDVSGLYRLAIGVIAVVGLIGRALTIDTPFAWSVVVIGAGGGVAAVLLAVGVRTRATALVAACAVSVLGLGAPAVLPAALVIIAVSATPSRWAASLLVAQAVAAAVLVAVLHRADAIAIATVAAGLLLFVPSALGRALASAIPSVDVVYDGRCSFCRASVERLLALDRFTRLVPMSSHDAETRRLHPDLDPEQAERELIVFAGGRVFGGYDGFRVIAARTPATWPVLPLLYVPPVPQIGRAVYRVIAARRMNRACAIDAEPPRRPSLPPPTRLRLPLVLAMAAVLFALELAVELALGRLV
jgi:predicted DCC family thiol-disulfide oxidoreductase YuxK